LHSDNLVAFDPYLRERSVTEREEISVGQNAGGIHRRRSEGLTRPGTRFAENNSPSDYGIHLLF
jgi:hypothetical protein